jgi:DNA-binding NarL/FixJ family response regulator
VCGEGARAPTGVLRSLKPPAATTSSAQRTPDSVRSKAPTSRRTSSQAVKELQRVYVAHMTIRVILAEDDFLMREGIRRVLEAAPDITVTAACVDGDELLAAVDADLPDIVVTDVRMPPSGADEGIRIANRLRRTHPAVGVLVLSQFAEPEYALALLEHGSNRRAYLLKERVHDRHGIIHAIRDVAAGGSAFDSRVVDALVSARAEHTSPLSGLSPREREVLAQVAQGMSNAAIAHSLVLTKSAVEKHINSIFGKLDLAGAQDVSQRVKAALMFLYG